MATALKPPSSQKAGDRPISFLLDNQAGGAPQAFVDLVIRPEDLSISTSSRMSVNQTLGGAFLDSFGAGIPQITISGHTGWRRTPSSDDDGIARFQRLKENVFDQWHGQRQTNIDAGIDPNQVRLIFSDALDDLSVVVAPQSFTLRRNKSRPLLCQYQITLHVVDTALQNAPYPAQFGFNGATPLNAVQQRLSGLQSLTASLNKIQSAIASVNNWVQSTLVAPIKAFMNQTAQLFGAVQGVIASATGVVRSVIEVATTAAQAGANIFRSLAAVASIPQFVKASLSAVASAYTNIFCVLRNAIHDAPTYADYASLYGSSNCSSTSGGRPPSTFGATNTFAAVVPTPSPLPFTISVNAASSLRSMAGLDTVLAPPSMSTLSAGLSSITSGLRIGGLGSFG